MEELKKVLASLLSEKLYQIIISNPRQKAGAFKIKVSEGTGDVSTDRL